MLKRALVVLLLIPLADAFLLIWVATWLGVVETVALVVLTALLGMVFVRAEGRRTIGKIQRSVAHGEQPGNELIDGGLLIAAGAFLLTPGLVTDVIGFLLVVPPTRIVIRTLLKRYVIVPYADEQSGGFVTGNVYVGGFPGDGATSGSDGDDTVDLDPDDYDVEDN